MVERSARLRNAVLGLGLVIAALVPVQAATIVKTSTFASGTALNATSPDSIAVSHDSIWVAYINSADSTGKSGSSVVAQYDFTGKLLNQFTFAGYVDGL